MHISVYLTLCCFCLILTNFECVNVKCHEILLQLFDTERCTDMAKVIFANFIVNVPRKSKNGRSKPS